MGFDKIRSSFCQAAIKKLFFLKDPKDKRGENMDDYLQKTFFISSRWRNRDVVLDLTGRMRSKGFKVISFLEYHPDQIDVLRDPEEVMREFETGPQNDQKVREFFNLDIAHIKVADVVVLLLPAGIAAHMEVGYAYGLGKECILIGEPEKTETVYCMFARRFSTIEDFIGFLEND